MLDKNKIQQYTKLVDDKIKEILSANFKDSKIFENMASYSFGYTDARGKDINIAKFRGKRFRPIIIFTLADFLNLDLKKVITVAAALEIFHNFSLVHDDIMDNDAKRRWRDTNWKTFGLAHSINIGDAMLTLSLSSVLQDKELSITARNDITGIGASTYLKVINGQFMDLSFESRNDIELSEYFKMIEGKTAVLISCAFTMSPLLAKKNHKEFSKLGFYFGSLYQIKDDVDGIWAKSTKTGKELFGDIKKRKKTLAVIYASSNLNKKDKKIFDDYYSGKKMKSADVTGLIEKSGALNYCQKIMDDYSQKIDKIIVKLLLTKNQKEKIHNFINFLIYKK